MDLTARTVKQLKSTLLGKRLDDEQLEQIAAHCQRTSFPAGELLFQDDNVAKQFFIIVEGCIRGIIHGHKGDRANLYFNKGDIFGQFSLLFNEPVMATVTAEFDTTVLTIERPEFMKLVEEIHEFRDVLGEGYRQRLKAIIRGERDRRFARSLLFVRSTPVQSSMVADIVVQLAERGERVVYIGDELLEADNVTRMELSVAQQVDPRRSFKEFDRVVMEIDATMDERFFLTIEHFDEVFWFYSAVDHEGHQKQIDTVFETTKQGFLKIKRICLLPPDRRYSPPDLVDDRLHRRDFIMPDKVEGRSERLYGKGISRIVRHLCDVKIGLSLAGGGARGLVHFGVLRALDNAGISFDLMSGTSAGSMFGLSYATGLETQFMLDAYNESLTPGFPFSWLPNGDRWFLIWKYRSRGWDRMIRKYFDCHFEQLQIPFYSVAVDMVRGKQVVSESGDIIHAMLESLNLPFIAKPIMKDGMALVDGGILNNLPASVLVDNGADYVVGVNVSDGLKEKFGKNHPRMTTSEMKRVGHGETLIRLLEVMGKGTADFQNVDVDLMINPDTSSFSFTDFTQGQGLADAGEAVVESVVPELKESIDRLMRFKRRQE